MKKIQKIENDLKWNDDNDVNKNDNNKRDKKIIKTIKDIINEIMIKG